jgi:nickel-dependent lactate racemase
LRLNPAAVNTDCLITVGGVRHHYFAGFGGGPKMVFPGVAGYEEIQANHSLVVDFDGREAKRNRRCEPGTLDGNPVAEEIFRAARLQPPDFALCLVEGRDGGVAWAGAGPWDTAFNAAVERVRSWCEVATAEPFELMVAGAGGRPTDSTLIQAHKSLDAACRFMAPEGELLLVASLDGGLGSDDMTSFIEDPRPQVILDKLSDDWIQYGHTTLRIVEKTADFRVHLHTSLDTRVVERLGFKPLPDPERVLDEWRQDHPGAPIGVMAGGAVYPRTA